MSGTSRITASFSAGELLLWLLRRLEQLPSATFRESELTSVSPSQFRALARQSLLVYQQRDPEQQRFPCPTPCEVGCDRVVGQVGGKTVAICEVWPEVVNVPLSAADLTIYSFGMNRFLECLREVNGITGSFGLLSDRLLRIGERRVGQVTTEAFLCLINDSNRAAVVLDALKNHRLTQGPALRLLPSFTVADPQRVRRLDRDGVRLATFSEAVNLRTLTVDFSILGRRSGKQPQSSLPPKTKAEEADYQNPKLAYLCEDRLFFLGSWRGRRHAIRINTTERRLADNLMRVLLRLVITLKQGRGGWVFLATLVVGRTPQQVISDLRKELRGALLEDEDGTKLIENDGKGRYRLSTHPNYVYPPSPNLPGSHDWFVLTLEELRKLEKGARGRRAYQEKRRTQRLQEAR